MFFGVCWRPQRAIKGGRLGQTAVPNVRPCDLLMASWVLQTVPCTLMHDHASKSVASIDRMKVGCVYRRRRYFRGIVITVAVEAILNDELQQLSCHKSSLTGRWISPCGFAVAPPYTKRPPSRATLTVNFPFLRLNLHLSKLVLPAPYMFH